MTFRHSLICWRATREPRSQNIVDIDTTARFSWSWEVYSSMLSSRKSIEGCLSPSEVTILEFGLAGFPRLIAAN